MDVFEINSSLRLLRTSVRAQPVPNAARSSLINFITSGKRFETLKNLRRQLRTHFLNINRNQSVNYQFIYSIFDTVHLVLEQLINQQFYRDAPNAINEETYSSAHNKQIGAFAVALTRNEILECLNIVNDTVSKLTCSESVINFTDSSLVRTLNRTKNIVSMQEDCYGKMFLADIIQLLGFQSSDVQRNAIRFLLLYISHTHNLHRFLEQFIKYGLESNNHSIQFGAVNSVGHLFVREELKAENLSLLIGALGELLVNTQHKNHRHILYPTYTALERLQALIGSRRFIEAIQQKEKTMHQHQIMDNNILVLYNNLRKRTPSSQIFLSQDTRCKNVATDRTQNNNTQNNEIEKGEEWKETIGNQEENGDKCELQNFSEDDEERDQEMTLRAWELGQFESTLPTQSTLSDEKQVSNIEVYKHCNNYTLPTTNTVHSWMNDVQLEHRPDDTDRDCPKVARQIQKAFIQPGQSYVTVNTATTTTTQMVSTNNGLTRNETMKRARAPSIGDIRLGATQQRVSFNEEQNNKIDSNNLLRRGSCSTKTQPKSYFKQSSKTNATSKLKTQHETEKPAKKSPLIKQYSKSTTHLEEEYSPESISDDNFVSEMTSTTYMPGYMSNYATLDADTLANLKYIPTLKDYYPYSYYYDPYYAAHIPPTTAAAAAATAAVASGANLTGAAASIHYGNRHLLRFGIFPRVLVYQALSSIAEEQLAAVQAIVRIIRDSPPEHFALLIPHLDEFLTVFLSQLLLDGASNFKVILWTLDIIELSSERLKHRLHPYLSQIVFLLTKRLGDNRIVIRDSVIKVFHQLEHRYCPQELLDLLFKHASAMIISGDNTTANVTSLAFTSLSKLREELSNRVTAALSTFPRGQLNLPKLCFDVAPLLVDRRSAVRLAALECTATLAQALGPHKLGSLMSAVHSLDAHTLTPIDLDRLVAAIQARLARRSLPRTGPDGNVTYVLRVPIQGEQPWYYRRIYDADLEWIAVGPTTPVSNVNDLYKHNLISTVQMHSSVPPTASSESSSDKQQSYKFSNDDERLARQEMIGTADSEDIPPPVKGTHSRTEQRLLNERSTSKLDVAHMAQDGTFYTRDFSSVQQQREYEQRSRSLERSKTVQEYRPYGKSDYFLDKFVRGESIDDSDLTEAQLYRKSSCESLEAWRQYFGRFKKQLAEIALTGNGTGAGRLSRPTSGAVYYNSPMPPYGMSPYYYYYCNGLSHSYHDLSQLQQQNMESIMKRTGFMTADSETMTKLSNVNNSPLRSPQEQKSISGEQKNKRNSVSVQNEQNDTNTQMLTIADTNLERSISMPTISAADEGNTLDDSLIQANTSESGNTNVISDEIIQELGMWDKAIQEEKKEGKSDLIHSAAVTEFETDETLLEEYDDETPIPELINDDKIYSISCMSRQQSKASDAHEMKSVNDEIEPHDSIPMVNIQNPTPSQMSAISRDDEPLSTADEPTTSPTKQRAVKFESEDDKEENENDKVFELKSESRSNSVAVLAKSKTNTAAKTVVKSGIPGPPARRLSRVPQQLYIKTTPAIPMNANIQHILGNVARTEGPFEYPVEAVKAALIALHDNAWTTKVEGMLAVVRLATFHPHYLLRDQHQIARLLCEETRNLRSTVARSSIFTIGELFSKLKSQLEPEMDILVQALLFKVGENSVFIREDIDRALSMMIDSMPQTRSIIALVTFGSNHRNMFVRRTSAQFVSILVERMGSMKCLLGPREMCEFILPSAARFVQDGSPHTRYFGRRMFHVLMQHPLFDRLLRKHISPGTYRNICGLLETIKRRGAGDRPADLFSPTVQAKDIDPRLLIVVDDNTSGTGCRTGLNE